MSRVRKEPDSQGKKIGILLFVLASLFILIFTSAQGKYHFPLSERIVMTVFAPFQGVANSAGSYVRKAMEGLWEIATVYEQNKMLKSEVEQLRSTQVKVNEVAAENERLRSLLNYKQTAPQFDLLSARVISRDPGSWTDTIVINLGANDGLAKDMAVVTAQGLVGNVVSVFPSTARVQLILDPRSAVGAIVQRPESRVAGIVEGNKSNPMIGRMVNIPRDADIVEGDQILTSGYGGVYPKGIAVGVVESIENDSGGLLKFALLKPAVDFQKLEEVAVITTSREAPPPPFTPVDPAEAARQNAAALGGGK